MSGVVIMRKHMEISSRASCCEAIACITSWRDSWSSYSLMCNKKVLIMAGLATNEYIE